MAEYTIELRHVLECGHKIFDFPYDIYNEEKRAELEKAFIQHFYFREICATSIDRFRLYLQDKFTTVFPYYNELMRTATIEYDVENPYNLTETYTRKSDSLGKASGVSSTVGRTEDEQTTEGTNERSAERSENASRENTGTVNGTTSESANDNVQDSSATNTETSHGKSTTTHDSKKFLDTPQGAVTLSGANYLTNLTETDNTQTNSGKDVVDQTVAGSRISTHSGSGESSSEETHNETSNLSGEESSRETASNSYHGTQKQTADNNTRSESIGQSTEEYTLTRKGNIGVNPASYEIDHHIQTQKTLKKIYQMFFDECEDLFMLVY